MSIQDEKKLKKTFAPDFLEKASRYLEGLTPAARGLVTEHKLGLATGELDFQMCRRLLEACVDLGLMKRRYAVVCPACSCMLYLQETPDIAEDAAAGEEVYCRYCDATYSRALLTEKDVRPIFCYLA